MKWIDKQLRRLSYAEGVQSVILGAVLGFLVALAIAALNDASAAWLLVSGFAGTFPGAVFMTAVFCLLAAASRRQSN